MLIKEIKRLRKLRGLTQTQLAHKADVSQSLIAKIEAGVIDPAYSKVQQIMAALQEDVAEKKASDLLHKGVMTVKEEDTVSSVIRLMRKHNISQVPVRGTEGISGLITEQVLLDSIAEQRQVSVLKCREVMRDAPPIVSMDTKESVVVALLRQEPAVIVADKGRVKGIISRSDVFSVLVGK